MTFFEIVHLIKPLDWVAVAVLVIAWIWLGHRIEHPLSGKPSVSALMAEYRRDWMEEFRCRENRVFDSQIVTSLRQSTTFFVSTCLLAIGGILALMGNPAPLQGVVGEFTAEYTPQVVWMLRLLPCAVFLVMAVLKFIWSNRVFGYCSIVMGSVPLSCEAADSRPRALRAAELNIRAAISFNRGLRAMYFALASLAWVLGPIFMLISSAAVIAFLWSREFASNSRAILLEGTRQD